MKLTCKGCIDERTCKLKGRCEHYTRVKPKETKYSPSYISKMEIPFDPFVMTEMIDKGVRNRWIRERIKYG